MTTGTASCFTPFRKAHVVIVGAGFAGLHAAKGLAAAPLDVTVIDRHNYHLFQPLLYQVATAGLSPADIASPIRSILRRRRTRKSFSPTSQASISRRGKSSPKTTAPATVPGWTLRFRYRSPGHAH
jgi:2-polyprenyl-6-methoxyphenol hydroxylase-like FAD-dependent oxidoreductase